MSEHIPSFTIKAKDRLALETIRHYRDLCEHYGLTQQAAEVTAAWIEMNEWQNAHPDQVKDPDHKHMPANGGRVDIADTILVVRESGTNHAYLYVDGVRFTYATIDGFTYRSPSHNKGSMPGVTLTIAARCVRVEDTAWDAS